MKKVIVTGSLNIDMSITAPYCPKGGETLTGGGFAVNCGGKGANQATACAKRARTRALSAESGTRQRVRR